MARSPKPAGSSDEGHLYATIDLGWMKNISEKYAVGGTLYVGAEGDGGQLGIRARVRRWLKPNLALDLAPGVVVTGNGVNENYPGLSGQLGLSLGDWVSVVTQVDAISVNRTVFLPPNSYTTKKDTRVTWYAGMKLGSYPGTVAIILLPIVGALIASSFEGGFGLGP